MTSIITKRMRMCFVVLYGLVGLVGCTPARENQVVVVFMLDTLRQDALGCYGNGRNPSPRIDEFARDGVRFEHAISSSGLTLPAVGSLLTGTWPTIHGAMGKGVLLHPIRDEVATAAEVFKQHAIGRWGSPTLRSSAQWLEFSG